VTQEFVIASAEDFAPKIEVVQLPSQIGTDKAVKLRKPDLIGLIGKNGSVPDLLSQYVTQEISGKKRKKSGGEIEITGENFPQLMEMMDMICIAAFIEPKLAAIEEPDGRHIPAAWIDFNDKSFVFSWALGTEYVPAERFRGQPGGDVGTLPAMPDVRIEAERGDGDQA